VQGGQYRALAKYTNQPLPQFPGVPSLSEAAGLPSIDESSTWIAVAAPAGTPKPIVDKIQNAIAKIYGDKATRERLEKVGINAVNSTSDQLTAFIKSESVRWAQVLKENAHLLKLEQ
jgi:tripartite-type tricarboxylate transporter receptor subunit TctC